MLQLLYDQKPNEPPKITNPTYHKTKNTKHLEIQKNDNIFNISCLDSTYPKLSKIDFVSMMAGV